jgi:tripartite-type tricarboxylate transporter receptor subunit TctC
MKSRNSNRWRGLAALAVVALVAAACGGGDTASPAPSPAPAPAPAPEVDELGGFPERPITVIVPYGAGGTVDITARILAQYIEPYLGTTMVVQNVTGAGGSIGFNEVFLADPDGYTLALSATPMVQHAYLLDVEYDYSSFEAVAMLTVDPNVLVTRPGSSADVATVAELIAASNANPGSLVMGVGGHWASHDIARAAFELETGATFGRVVLEGGAGVVAAMLGNQIPLGFNYIGEFASQFEAGELKVLAVAADERSPFLPDTPTLKEQGVNLSIGVWRGIVAPKGTPEAILRRLEEAILATTQDPAWQQAMTGALIAPVVLGRDAFAEVLRDSDAQALAVTDRLRKEGFTQ